MVDFNDSFRRGLDAAKRAQANREEIKEVFSRLNQALLAMTDGKVEIAIVPLERTMNALARMIVSLNKDKTSELAIAVRPSAHPDAQARKLALWREGEAGYPCSIIWGERHASCDDAESLKTELGELVSSPTVGEAIVATLNFQPNADA